MNNLQDDLDETVGNRLGRLYLLRNELDKKIETMLSGWAPFIAPGV